MSNLNPGGLTRVLNYIKTWVTGLLNDKANSSHSHTKSQITDFPAYGNTAGTICQGNDSRLSDARTPTSHTHTKSQITDFPSLSTVATSGSYNDLSNKPSIPSIDLRPQASADANTVSDGVSITHYGANGPSTSLGATTNDGALFQQCWSSDWKAQIAADYRNGNLFTRGKNSGTWQPWRAVAYHGDNVSKFTNDSGYITSSGSCNYANSAGYASSASGAGYLGDIGSTDRNGASGTGWYSVGFSYSYDEGHNELAINNYWGIRLNCRDSDHVTVNGSRINVENATYLNGYRIYVG